MKHTGVHVKRETNCLQRSHAPRSLELFLDSDSEPKQQCWMNMKTYQKPQRGRAHTDQKVYRQGGGVNTCQYTNVTSTYTYMTYCIKHKGVGDGFDHFRGIVSNRGTP